MDFKLRYFFAFLLISLIISTPVNSCAQSDFQEIKSEYESILTKKYILLPHRGNFLAPFSHNSNPNNTAYQVLQINNNGRGEFNKETEAEFQISFLMSISQRLFGSDLDLFIGYTHRSWWQIYNDNWSRPFRETNYTPEVFARKLLKEPINFLGGKFLAYDFGYMHQSNGQIQELSRSWDRVFFRFVLMYNDFFIRTSIWHRLREDKAEDDNPDILQYMGYGEIEIDKFFNKNRLQLRVIPGTRKQGAEFTYSYPISDNLRLFTRYSYGYGLSMIDYNHKSQRVSIGFMLADLLDIRRKSKTP